jgi:hypothetical protein
METGGKIFLAGMTWHWSQPQCSRDGDEIVHTWRQPPPGFPTEKIDRLLQSLRNVFLAFSAWMATSIRKPPPLRPFKP